jgi:hypothetical protein
MRKFLLPAFFCLCTFGLFQQNSQAQLKGPSSSQTCYVVPVASGVQTTGVLSTPDLIGGYKMCGTPDGLGAFDNGNGTFTLLMNHEFQPTSGVVRAHGSTGSFVSKWIINKSNLSVVSGGDLIQNVKLWNGSGYSTFNAANPSTTARFNRFCSADLPPLSAFYDNTTGNGTQERLYMNGEESGDEGRAFAHIITGPNAGTSYELPYLGKFSHENSVANPATGDKTVVAGLDDAGGGQVYFYIGTKTNAGNEIERAGLTNGKLYSIKVTGYSTETSANMPAPGTTFTMFDLGDVHNLTGAALNTNSNTNGITGFLRPEDGAWDPLHPEDFYFVTTNAFNSPSRLWRLHFNNINDLTLGGTITAVLDGTEGQQMFDNIAIDHWGHVLLLEDVGNNAHNGKVWQYTIATDQLVQIAHHDVARFGDIGIAATAPYNQDEETSGIIDMQEILGAGYFLLDDQAHYSIPGDAVEGGQLILLFNPGTYNACANYSGNISVSPSPTVTGQANNTIYLGYGPQSVTLAASVPSGFPPYNYSWTSSSSTSSSISVSPTTTTNYIVTIKNAFGCAINVSQTINVKDIRDGDKNKVFICHNGHTQSVSVNAVPSFIVQADQLGTCDNTISSVDAMRNEQTELHTSLFPNPASNIAHLSFTMANDAEVKLSVVDLQGRIVMKPVMKKLKAGQQLIDINTSSLSEGIYFVELNYNGTSAKIKLIVLQ